ncbi:hypothetical protein Tco_0292193 [Tanacetum coccineum]
MGSSRSVHQSLMPFSGLIQEGLLLSYGNESTSPLNLSLLGVSSDRSGKSYLSQLQRPSFSPPTTSMAVWKLFLILGFPDVTILLQNRIIYLLLEDRFLIELHHLRQQVGKRLFSLLTFCGSLRLKVSLTAGKELA